MASIPTKFQDLCEPGDPDLLNQAKKSAHFQDAVRVQESVTAGMEKRALIWIAGRLPAWVTPDHLTILGFFAQVMAGVSFVLAGANKLWLFSVILCLAMNWFGDSLDGTLARVRQQLRPLQRQRDCGHYRRRHIQMVRRHDQRNQRRGIQRPDRCVKDADHLI